MRSRIPKQYARNITYRIQAKDRHSLTKLLHTKSIGNIGSWMPKQYAMNNGYNFANIIVSNFEISSVQEGFKYY